jgi:hypothetical protein
MLDRIENEKRGLRPVIYVGRLSAGKNIGLAF